ncbi:hypothetical protein GGR52DRAFT_570350 [Hypoxylon sp. FL1284]|nr:hypothetical protein GGR52DRAFT_570350 [Hypoxylon sp. FL1284]
MDNIDADDARQQILMRYGYDGQFMQNDCIYMSELASRRYLDNDRIDAIRWNDLFISWGVIIQSSLILLDGGTDLPTDDEVSLAAAGVVLSMLRQRGRPDVDLTIVPLAFFCGCHRLDQDGTVTKMAMTLLLSLLDFYNGFDVATLRECLEGMDERDFRSVLDAFGKLINRLPSNVLVSVVIEGLEVFTQPPERGLEMQEAMIRLIAIHAQGSQATLKFLFTHASRINPIRRSLFQDQVVTIPR